MKQCLTDRQQGFVDMAGRLADKFAERSAVNDTENAFPFENYEDMRKAGFLKLSLPEELGGLGATQAEVIPAIERLAMGDGPTALAVSMHISPLGQWSAVWRRTKDPKIKEFLQGAADGKVVWASITSEIGMPNLMTDARTIATKVDGGYLINGRKNFGTNTAAATHCSTTARYEDPVRGPRLMLFRVDLGSNGVTIIPTWDMMGMRATQSNDVEYTDLFVSDAALVHSLPVGHLDARIFETVFAWAMPTFGAVYTGIAAGALDWARRQVIRRGLATRPLTQDVVAECEILLEESRAVLYRHTDLVTSRLMFERLGVQEGLAQCAFVKYVCTNNAAKIMHKLVDIVGGAAYVRKLPFERMWRDCQAGLFMPFANQPARELIGATSLGVDIAPVITAEQSGLDSKSKIPATSGSEKNPRG